MKLGYNRKVLEKYSDIKFHENMSSGSRVFHVDRRTWRNIRHFATAPK